MNEAITKLREWGEQKRQECDDHYANGDIGAATSTLIEMATLNVAASALESGKEFDEAFKD